MEEKIPEIDNEFFCIANYENPLLSAIVSSYVSKFGKYLPMFEFLSVTIKTDDENDKDIDEHQLSRVRATELNIKIKNTLNRIGGCNILLLIDLSDDQKSYLTFLEEYTIIEIKDVYDVEMYLRYASNKTEYLSCKSNNIHLGLYFASENNLLLKIDENAEKIVLDDSKDGIIIIENIKYVSTIIAVNYAISVNATIKIIEPVELGEREIYQLLEKWQDGEGDINSYNDLSANIYPNVENINFIDYRYATFFTIGVPYSLILQNIIPFTHVHLYLNPDFFIFNNIYFENNDEIKSGIVFSPLEFNDEETDFVISKLSENNFYVKELIGKDATVYNIDNHVKEYPFDILHICSHGGEINGFSITEEFIDSNGDSHIIEYDEVVSFAPFPGKELIPVTTKMIWRKFNGFNWKSKELKKAGYPHYVFSDMLNAIPKNKNKNRIPKSKVPNSCSIKCFDFNYQAMFNLLAGHNSPFIFNNTCWSYSDISHKFIEVGARAYIGTLWGVNNNIAKKTAESFYDELFRNTILHALQKSLVHTKGTKDENIYLIWGLHFTSIKAGTSNEESKKAIALRLMQSTNIWIDKLRITKRQSTRKNIIELIEWNKYQLGRFFINEIKALIAENKK